MTSSALKHLLALNEEAPPSLAAPVKHGHYFRSVKGLEKIDIYRFIDLFGLADPALQHALKKVVCAGQRGAKDVKKDVQEAIDTLQRWQEMQAENEAMQAHQ